MEMERNEIGHALAWQLSSEHYDFVLYEDWWFWRFRARPYLVKECDNNVLHFAGAFIETQNFALQILSHVL